MPEDTAATPEMQQPETTEAENGPAPTAGTGSAGTLTQADVDRIVQERLGRASKAHEAERRQLAEKLAAYEQAEEERKKAEMTEVERAQAEAKQALARATQIEAELAAERIRTKRAEAVARDAADLPAAYRSLVTGDTDDAIAESIKAAQEMHQRDAAAFLRQLATRTPEEIAALGEEGKSLVERLSGKPPSIGAAPAAGQEQTAAAGGEAQPGTLAAWMQRAHRTRGG